MGSEAGQSLDAIIRRKELERVSGRGLFAWGIGNSVGPAVRYARSAIGCGELEALFTPMKSPPKPSDVSPESIAMWLGYYSEHGTVDRLPDHMLVTSRGHQGSGGEKQSHYALICRSDESLSEQESGHASVDPDAVRNLVSSNPVGSSQVTAIVRRVASLSAQGSYPVLFRAKLAGQCFVRLAAPIILRGHLRDAYSEACVSTSHKQWSDRITKLKKLAFQFAQNNRAQASLF